MPTMTVEEAWAKLPELVQRLGPGEEIVLTQENEVVARLVGERRPRPQRPGPGLCKDMIKIVSDDEEHLEHFAEYLP